MDVSRSLSHARNALGALKLESAEVKVVINPVDKSTVQKLLGKEHIEMHDIVAECMIFANNAVATKISEAFPSVALLRNHPKPKEEQFHALIQSAAVKGFAIDVSSNQALAASLNAAVDPLDVDFNRVLRTQATMAMEAATYFCCGSLEKGSWDHYGLAVKRYTHFTSPIRRYADTSVHRQLMAALKVMPNVGETSHDYELDLATDMEIVAICEHLNQQNRASKICQRQSMHYFMALYYAALSPCTSSDAKHTLLHSTISINPAATVDAVVVGIRGNCILCYSTDLGVQCRVRLHRLSQGLFKCSSLAVPAVAGKEEYSLIDCVMQRSQDGLSVKITSTDHGSLVIPLFGHVRVQIYVESSPYHHPELAMSLISLKQFVDADISAIHEKHTKIFVDGGSFERHPVVELALQGIRTSSSMHIAEAYSLSVDAGKISLCKPSMYDLLEDLKELALLCPENHPE